MNYTHALPIFFVELFHRFIFHNGLIRKLVNIKSDFKKTRWFWDDNFRPELAQPFYEFLDDVSHHPFVKSTETEIIKNTQGDPALKIHVIHL